MRTVIQVAGPKSFELLQRLTTTDLTAIKFAHFQAVEFAGHPGNLVRLTMSGELGFEIQCPAEAYDEVYDKIFQAGQDLGIARIGSRNHFQQHFEAAIPGFYDGAFAICDPADPYVAWLQEVGDMIVMMGLNRPKITGSYEPKSIADFYLSPVDLGMDRLINLDHEFPGRKALEEELAHPKRKRVVLEWNKDDVVDVYASMFSEGESHVEVDDPHFDYMEMPRDPRLPIEASTVLRDGQPIAFTVSRTYSYAYRKMLSHCFMPIEHAAPGTQVTVVWGNPGHPQKLIRATVAEAPYKPDRSRGVPALAEAAG